MDFRSYFALPLALAALGGCSTLAPDGGFTPVAVSVQERTGAATRLIRTDEDAADARAFIADRLALPVTPDAAVAIALINNPGLQARYAELGIAQAQLVQAGRLPNPRFSFSHIGSGDTLEIERRFAVDVMSVLVMPLTLKLEGGRFALAQSTAAVDALRVAAEARRAAVSATAAAQGVRYYEQVLVAAEASAELARQMVAVGNWNKLNQMRQQVFHADALAQLARARNAAALARERLARVIGLAATPDAIVLPERLPDLPAAPRVVADVVAVALAQRLDVRMARQGLDATVYALGLTRATRFVNVFDLAYRNKNDAGAPRRNGYEIEIEVPLFDWGDAKLAKAEAIYRQAASELAETSGNAQSEARAAYDTYRTTYALARQFRDDIVPLRKRIADENQLRYNAMQISVFELLADAREQVMSVYGAIEAQRDFWLAEADLQAATIGGAGGAGTALAPRTGDAAVAPPAH
ncbi:MAG: TolC family protein [Casimicrobiaceae bacterium]